MENRGKTLPKTHLGTQRRSIVNLHIGATIIVATQAANPSNRSTPTDQSFAAITASTSAASCSLLTTTQTPYRVISAISLWQPLAQPLTTHFLLLYNNELSYFVSNKSSLFVITNYFLLQQILELIALVLEHQEIHFKVHEDIIILN